MLTNATLPSKQGYVEVEADGRRTYRNAITGVLIDEEKQLAALEPRTTEQRLSDLEAALGTIAASIVTA